MALFSGLPIPWEYTRSNSSASQALIGGYNARTSRMSVELQRQSRIDQLQFREQQMKAQLEASKQLVDSMRAFGVEDEEGMARYLVQNPGAALSPYTGELVKNLASVFSNMTRVKLAAQDAENRTYEGRVKMSIANTFWKDLASVPPTEQAAVLEMEEDQAKIPSGNQFRALGIIVDRIKKQAEVAKKPTGEMLDIEGIKVPVVYGPSGAPTVIRQPKDVTEEASKKRLTELNSRDLKFADDIAKAQRTFASAEATKDTTKMKAAEAELNMLMKQRGDLQEQIKSLSSPQTQTESATTAPAGAPKVGDVMKGYRFKGGDPADPNSWDKVQ